MREIRLKISDVFALDGEESANPAKDLATVTAHVLKHYAFLPKPLMVTIEADEAVLRFPEEDSAVQAEAARLADKAAKRASEGNYVKAINIYKRVLELQPSFHAARRDLAMAYVEVGDVDSATNHLIEVLRLAPQDAWSWVVLANLYVSKKSDLDTGEKFLRKALEIAPNDSWALNSLAAIHQQRGEVDEAIALYERAIEANPEFANPHDGENKGNSHSFDLYQVIVAAVFPRHLDGSRVRGVLSARSMSRFHWRDALIGRAGTAVFRHSTLAARSETRLPADCGHWSRFP